MAQWVLQQNGQIVPWQTLRRLNQEELSHNNLVELAKREAFDAEIKERLGDSILVPPEPDVDESELDEYEVEDSFDEESLNLVIPVADAGDSTRKPINQQSIADLLINAEVLLDHGKTKQMAKVLRRSIDVHGKIIGNLDRSLMSLVCDVEFPDSAVKQYAANVIAENVLSQVDSAGHHYQLLDGIDNHQRLGNAVSKANAYITTKRGVRRLRQTTIGWRFHCKWRDGTSSWVSLKVLKESNPIEIAEYMTAMGFSDKPEFSWWVLYTLKKRDRVIAAVYT